MGSCPGGLDPRGAFTELQGVEDYAGERCDLAPMELERLSLPSPGFQPCKIDDLLKGLEPDYIQRFVHDNVLPKEIAARKLEESGLKSVYSDPIMRSRKKRAELVRLLLDRNLVELCEDDGVRVGVFAVKKSDGVRQRLIIDARGSNSHFTDPKSPDLPTGASLSRLWLEDSSTHLFCSSADLKDAFYTLELPPPLRSLFTLDPVRARDLNVKDLGGVKTRPDMWLYPRLKVVPMGWSHAVNICQDVVRQLVLNSPGIRPSMLVSDSKPFPDVKESSILIYVDNVIVLNTCQEKSRVQMRGIAATLRNSGLVVHDEHYGEDYLEALGWEIHCSHGVVRPKRRRAWRLQLALEHALDRQVLSGKQLARLVGHYVSMGLLRRETLAAVSACYAFYQRYPYESQRLWPSVVRELRWMKSLIPLQYHCLRRPTCTRVLCCDASGWGKGVVHAQVDSQHIEDSMKYSEKWRFRYAGDGGDARTSALERALGINMDLGADQEVMCESSAVVPDLPFVQKYGTCERTLFGVQWKVLHSRPWQRQEHITALEARSITWSVRHVCKGWKSFGQKFLIVTDSMVNALALGKGRSSAPGLSRPVRQWAAVCLRRNVVAILRWLPSELNYSDWGSRGVLGVPAWEDLVSQGTAAWQRIRDRKAGDEVRPKEVRRRGEGARQLEERHPHGDDKQAAEVRGGGEEQGVEREVRGRGPPPVEGGEGEGEAVRLQGGGRRAGKGWEVTPRREVDPEAVAEELRAGVERVQRLPERQGVEKHELQEPGRPDRGVLPGAVLRGRELGHGLDVAGSSWMGPSSLGQRGKAESPPCLPGLARLQQARPAAQQAAAAGAGRLRAGHGSSSGWRMGRGIGDPPGLPPLPTARGAAQGPVAALVKAPATSAGH